MPGGRKRTIGFSGQSCRRERGIRLQRGPHVRTIVRPHHYSEMVDVVTTSQKRWRQNVGRAISKDIRGYADRAAGEAGVFTVTLQLILSPDFEQVLPRTYVRAAETDEPTVFCLPARQGGPKRPNPS